MQALSSLIGGYTPGNPASKGTKHSVIMDVIKQHEWSAEVAHKPVAFGPRACPPLYAAHLCFMQHQRASAPAPTDEDEDEVQQADYFEQYVEVFNSNYWRRIARSGTFEILGFADNQGTDDQSDFIADPIWATQAQSGSMSLYTAWYEGGYYGVVAVSDEGYHGGLVFKFTVSPE